MNEYKSLASALQSRIAKRAQKITENDMWRRGYRSLNRLNDWRDTKDVLKCLTKEQQLDKKLLRITQELAYADAHFVDNEINWSVW